jgi:hypothetical protein
VLNFGQDSALCIKSSCLASTAFPQHGRLDLYGTRFSYSDEFLFTEAGSGDYVHDSDSDDDDGGSGNYHHHNTCRLLQSVK